MNYSCPDVQMFEKCVLVSHYRAKGQRSSFALLYDPVCEYNDEPRLEDHVVAHVHVVARHHRDGLPPGDAPAHILLVLPLGI